MSTIVCFGEALIDFLAAPIEGDGQGRVFRQFAGGAPANAAVAIARLGGTCEFVGMLGKDMFGDFLLDSLRAAGVGTHYVRTTDQAKTALAFVSLDVRGERSFSFHRPPAADLLFAQDDFDDDCFRDLGIFHVCSNSLTDANIAETTITGMKRAHAAGALTSFDVNLRPSLWPAGKPLIDRIWQALALADMVKLAREELEFLQQGSATADATIARLLHDARLVLVTDGAAPIRWHTRNGSGTLPTQQVVAVDTTAAGDAFIGGLLCGLQRDGVNATRFDGFLADTAALEHALRYAAACGAFAVTRHGAFAALPTHEEALAVLATMRLP
ncbi:carbohydrate kinase family protein [Solilutibacter silvestris]|uniref:Sugar kinase ribokinase family n=1 Tax=Solilutibacter silvestris TaxID=1645665 RepID=A0A2K1Q105_9GAMM|nr:carbohydrate kinase [Lysobacter silvestris]PNS08729.1 Sugar kinase ribokinase family [Lysobacter silvestris]